MLTLEVKEREQITKHENHQLRTDGFIPGIVYGGEKNLNIYANYADFIKTLKKAGRHDLIQVKFKNKEFMSLIKDFQLHPVKDTFIHFDLLEVQPEKEIRTKIPIEFVGTPKGLTYGGVLEELQSRLLIAVKAKDLPHSIKVDISNMGLGDTIHVKDITPPPGAKFLDAPSTVVVLVAAPKAAVEETPAAEEEATTETKAADAKAPAADKSQDKK